MFPNEWLWRNKLIALLVLVIVIELVLFLVPWERF
ncbi:hypothetical protein Dd703_2376 [Musicola paradisiaca Ech703]|uniref:Uncharacterized protein n=1 Tax=Musicola paradisiaca (strain Ech703) TaxID=579405 RepID=C6C8J2_MUSP7|nr:hypothetical protein Dd703_2376 [Musicola paradisiaca Ech703]